jgi:hypothetical protein
MAPISVDLIEQNPGATVNLAGENLPLRKALSEIEACWQSGAAITFYTWLYLRRLARHGGKSNVTHQTRWLSLSQWHLQ